MPTAKNTKKVTADTQTKGVARKLSAAESKRNHKKKAASSKGRDVYARPAQKKSSGLALTKADSGFSAKSTGKIEPFKQTKATSVSSSTSLGKRTGK